MSGKKALILGVGGMDGSYLADCLLARGYDVHGLYRRSSVDNLWRIHHIQGKIQLHQGDITDPTSVSRVLSSVSPDFVFNEADQDHIGWSYNTVGVSWDVTAKAVATTLELIKEKHRGIKFFQPVSSTIFGNEPPRQSETTRHNPQSPYACAKSAAYHICRYYRNVCGLFVSVGIMFNHDSPRRGEEYLLHQISRQALDVKAGRREFVEVGDPDMVVDIGHAKDYMSAVRFIMELVYPDDFVVGTGEAVTIRQIVQTALSLLDLDKGCIKQNENFLRPGSQPKLVADTRKLQQCIGWTPQSSLRYLLLEIMKKYDSSCQLREV